MRECITHHDACHCREAKATSDMAVLRAENARLRAVAAFVEAKEPLVNEVLRLRAALKGVLAVADRKTKEFDAARAALGSSTSSDSDK